MKEPHIKITTNGITKTEVEIGGKKLKGVTGIRFVQNYKENNGLPILQIDLKATNVEIDAKILPALPEPFNGFYIPITELFNSEEISNDTVIKLCRECGIETD